MLLSTGVREQVVRTGLRKRIQGEVQVMSELRGFLGSPNDLNGACDRWIEDL